jgi:flagellar biogenesis protein FliO
MAAEPPVTVAGLQTQTFSEMAKKEELPLFKKAAPAPLTSRPATHWARAALALGLVVLFAVGAIFGFRRLTQQKFSSGSRKYLIEKLSYCPVGPKLGVALIKVGKEFVLIGVGPEQVSFLSTLPKLQAQYEEEQKFEGDSFSAAVEEEYRRIKTDAPVSV